MPRRPRPDAGFHHTNIEMLILVAIIGIIAAVAIPFYLGLSKKRALKCLDTLAAITEDAPPAGAMCPACDKPYAIEKKDGVETLACPDPGKHLVTDPRFVRSGGKAWEVRQTLPPFAAGTAIDVASWAEAASMETRGTVTMLEVQSRGWYRYTLSLLLQLLMLIFSLAGCGLIIQSLRPKQREPGGVVVGLIVGVIAGWCLWSAVLAGWGVKSVEFERERVVLRQKLGGREIGSPTVYEHCRLVAAVKVQRAFAVVLLHGEKDSRTETDLFTLAEASLGAISTMQQALQGPR